jgi:pimeloyl-ACP methyl ester carboxylesterase
MPDAVNDGVRIHYEVEGAGPTVLLHAGLAMCGEDWRDFGQVEVLKQDFRLILVDGRGFGSSDKPHDPAAYDLPLLVSDLTAILDDLGLKQAHYYGHSYGGGVGWDLAAYAPSRFRSLIISGAHPYGESSRGIRDLLQQSPEAFLGAIDEIYGPHMNPTRRARLEKNDFKALLAMSNDRPSLEDALPSMHMPLLLIIGEDDPKLPQVQQAFKHLPNADMLALPITRIHLRASI